LPIIWALLAALLLKTKRSFSVVVAVLLLTAAVLGLFSDKFMVITIFLREFYPVWEFVGNAKDWLPIIIHGAVLLLTVVAIWLAFKADKPKAGWLTALSVLALGTVAAVCLSPTMYASNYRTLYVASLLLVMIIVVLSNQLLSSSKSRR
jgi:peptidoglycan/LPS O-acetylase OafA/YrhL